MSSGCAEGETVPLTLAVVGVFEVRASWAASVPATGSHGTVEGVHPRLVVGLLAVEGRSYV